MKTWKQLLLLISLAILLAAAFAADVCTGSSDIGWQDLLRLLRAQEKEGITWTVLHDFRLPKALTAMLCGAGLSIAGLMMQTLFRNPLAGPYVLGLSSGAGLGVALVILGAGFVPALIAYSGWAQVIAAIAGALLVLLLVLSVSTRITDSVTLLIVGMMLGSLAGAAVNVLQAFANPDALKVYILWTMGSLTSVTWTHLAVMWPPMVAGLILAIGLQKTLNVLLLGEGYARSMGVSVFLARAGVILSTCLLAGVSTAFTGPIAFIGMAVPHIARGLVRTADHRILLPASALTGAALLLVCDLVSQLPGTGYTLPVNSVCALVGVPITLWVVFKNKKVMH